MDIIDTIALSMGVGWASGLNLYAAILTLGYLGTTGDIALPPDLQILTDPLVLFAAGIMYCIEFFVDKTPGVDTGWDVVHTFIRIPAGAVLAGRWGMSARRPRSPPSSSAARSRPAAMP